jgi:hypothetical protein
VPERVHLEQLAARGHAQSIAWLLGPDYPPELDYLRSWVRELHGRSGVGMSGLSPLTYSTIADWARLKGFVPEPHEVDALIALDAVMLYPGKREEE